MITAAGGILEKQTAEGPKIAVVYRERHGKEWSLPKGKQKPDEKPEQTALREVAEETGCTGMNLRYAGTVDYLVEGKPKIVFFWRMDLEKEMPFTPSDEVQKLEWLTPAMARRRLTHKSQQELLRRLYPGKPWICTYDLAIFFLKRTKRWQRLASSIHSYREELGGLVEPASAGSGDHVRTARKLLDDAWDKLQQGYIDWGWKLYHAARRMELLSLGADEPKRTIHARIMLQEGSKITGWRGNAIKELAAFADNKPPTAEALYQAALVRDEYFNNNAYKGLLLRRQSLYLAFVLAVVLTGLLSWSLIPSVIPPDYARKNAYFEILIMIGLFGLLGGTLSAITSAPKSMDTARIPEMTTAFQVTLLRLFTGFASAIIIFLVLHSNMADQFFAGVFSEELAANIKKMESFTSYFIAFCAGFSERLVLRAVEYVAGK